MFTKMAARWLLLLVLGAGCVAVARSGGTNVNRHGPTFPGENYGVQKLAENVYAYIGQDGGSNSGFIITPEGVIVIDTRNNAELAQAVLADIRQITSAPIKYVIITHHHGDHTGGIVTYEEQKAIIVSHKECRATMQAKNNSGLPNLTFDGMLQLYLGGREVQILHPGWGHSKSDAIVYLPDANVVFVGDLLFAKRFPYCSEGNLTGWLAALDKIKAFNAKAIVPGHGPVSTNAEIDGLMTFFKDAQAQVADLKKQGKTLEEAKAAVNFTKYKNEGWGSDRMLPRIVEWMW